MNSETYNHRLAVIIQIFLDQLIFCLLIIQKNYFILSHLRKK